MVDSNQSIYFMDKLLFPSKECYALNIGKISSTIVIQKSH